jgi:hypothetical protein
LAALGKHQGNAEICQFASAALAYIAAHKDVNRDACVKAGVLPAIITALGHHAGNMGVLTDGCLALKNIATNSDARRDACAAANAIPAIVRALTGNAADADLCGNAGGALAQIIFNSPAHRAAAVAAGAVAPLVAALKAHPEYQDLHIALQKLGFNDDGTPLGGGGGGGGGAPPGGGAGGAPPGAPPDKGKKGPAADKDKKGPAADKGKKGAAPAPAPAPAPGAPQAPKAKVATAKKGGAQGGGSRSDSEDDDYNEIPIESLIKQQTIWESANNIYKMINPEVKPSLPSPGPPPALDLVKPLVHFLRTNADEDKLEEARGAIGLLSPQDLDILMNPNDYSSAVTQRIHGLYEKALPQARLYWIPTIVRADILSEFFKAR